MENLIKEANAFLNYHIKDIINEKINDTKLFIVKKIHKRKN